MKDYISHWSKYLRFEHVGWWWFVNYLNCKLCLIYCRNNVLVYNKWPKKRVFTVLHCLCTSCRGSLCVLQADELEYTFKRLVDGLAHTREAARPGFSLALGQVSRIYLWSCICRYLNCMCDKIMSSQRFTELCQSSQNDLSWSSSAYRAGTGVVMILYGLKAMCYLMSCRDISFI